jgi:two-component system NarL family sensor kinase
MRHGVAIAGLLLQRLGADLLIALVAAGCVAALFLPLRERLQRGVNRLLFGDRDSPYDVVAHLGRRLETALAQDAVLPTIVESVSQALRLPHASIWLIEEQTLHLAA